MRRTLLAAIGALAVLVAFVAVPTSAWADTVYSNFGTGGSFNASNGYEVCSSIPSAPSPPCSLDGYGIAAAFTPSAEFTLSQIDVAFSLVPGGYSGAVTIDLVNDSSGLPASTVLESWSLTATTLFGNSYTPQSLLDTQGVTLSSGSQYWVTALPAGSGTWARWNVNDIGDSAGGAYDYRGGMGWLAGFGATPAFDVLGTPVSTPEPASIALIGTALLGLGLAGLFGRKRFPA